MSKKIALKGTFGGQEIMLAGAFGDDDGKETRRRRWFRRALPILVGAVSLASAWLLKGKLDRTALEEALRRANVAEEALSGEKTYLEALRDEVSLLGATVGEIRGYSARPQVVHVHPAPQAPPVVETVLVAIVDTVEPAWVSDSLKAYRARNMLAWTAWEGERGARKSANLKTWIFGGIAAIEAGVIVREIIRDPHGSPIDK